MKEMPYEDIAERREEMDLRIIDVRETDEYEEVHVHDVELFPLSRLREGELPDEDDRQVACICRSGGRSAIACNLLERAGWDECINVAGGTLAAIEAGDDHVVRGDD